MDSSADAWDERYAGAGRVWSATPNRWVAELVSGFPLGRALDLAAGEGRNAVWLAEQGWEVDATDFSTVAVDRIREWARDRADTVEDRLHAWVADATDPVTPTEHAAYDLVLQSYLHLPPDLWERALRAAVERTRSGGTILLVGHAARNLDEGVGGPQDRRVLFDPEDVRALAETLPVDVQLCELREREVAGADRPAFDTVALLSRR
jgi:SAM-dependent methyltransferase